MSDEETRIAEGISKDRTLPLRAFEAMCEGLNDWPNYRFVKSALKQFAIGTPLSAPAAVKLEVEKLPCPFCGHPGVFVQNTDSPIGDGYRHAECSRCGAEGPPSPSEQEAIERWNKPAALIAALQQNYKNCSRDLKLALLWFPVHEELSKLLGTLQDADPNYQLGLWQAKIQELRTERDGLREENERLKRGDFTDDERQRFAMSRSYDETYFKEHCNGSEAFERGESRDSNPYRDEVYSGTLYDEAWDDGWLTEWAKKNYDTLTQRVAELEGQLARQKEIHLKREGRWLNAMKSRSPQPPAKLEEWTDEKNDRRIALIEKKYSDGINEDEQKELTKLQGEISAHLNKTCPLPTVVPPFEIQQLNVLLDKVLRGDLASANQVSALFTAMQAREEKYREVETALIELFTSTFPVTSCTPTTFQDWKERTIGCLYSRAEDDLNKKYMALRTLQDFALDRKRAAAAALGGGK